MRTLQMDYLHAANDENMSFVDESTSGAVGADDGNEDLRREVTSLRRQVVALRVFGAVAFLSCVGLAVWDHSGQMVQGNIGDSIELDPTSSVTPVAKKKFFKKYENRNKFWKKKMSQPKHMYSLSDAEFSAQDDFEKFLLSNPRKYHTKGDVNEYKSRLKTFAANLKLIDQRNADEKKNNKNKRPATHGVTKYADMTSDEFKAMLGYKPKKSAKARVLKNSTSSPELIAATQRRLDSDSDSDSDSVPCEKAWSDLAIRNQGQCGDCWTFSTAETVRAAYIQQGNADPGKLSTQFIVDCMTQTTCSGGVNGCCGGNPAEAMEWIAQQGGIPTQAAYGDTVAGDTETSASGLTDSGNNPTTVYSCKTGIAAAVTMTSDPVQQDTEDDMAEYVCKTGILSIAVDASKWQTYTGGVLDASSCTTTTDHAVIAIGLNKTDNAWIVQNSWGPDWGVALDGTTPPVDEYSNCAQMASAGECEYMVSSTQTVADVCPVSCGSGVALGGYIYLEYGSNTCGITTDAVSAGTTAAP